MTKQEAMELIKKLAEKCYEDYDNMGVRFEDKDRNVGETIEECSRHNEDRDDERDFPEYGTEEYVEMEELDGVSAWSVDQMLRGDFRNDLDKPFEYDYYTNHCYFIAGDFGRNNETGDVGETIVKNAKVIAKLF